MKTKNIVKFICLLVALSLVTFLVIPGSNKEAKWESIKAQEVEKVKKGALPEPPITQKAVQEALLPQKEPFEEPEEAQTDIIKTLQGRVTGVELVCTDMVVMVDGIHLDAGSVDVTGIQIGDVVEVTYLKMKYAKFVQSIEVLEPVEGKRLPKKEPLREPAKAVEKGGCLLKRWFSAPQSAYHIPLRFL